ncbi:hypothetical protein [Streptomyces sp. NPDC007172]|uniref:hypothetical protein n=1 Tax=Streptomyces sp. NPDC007172 TaxID=3364776 RepID=UPI0036C47C93
MAFISGILFSVTFTCLGPDVNAMTPGILALILVWAVACSVISVAAVWIYTVLGTERGEPTGRPGRPGRPSKNPEG